MIGEKHSEIYEEIEATLYEHHGTKPNFTDNGFRAACKIFIDAVMDKMWDKQEEENKSLDDETIKKLNGKLIHKDIWMLVSDASLVFVEDDTLHYEKGGVRAQVDISCDLKFPDHKSIIESVANSIFDKKSFVCFNPKFIQIAAKIFPSEILICRFYENNDMMVFFPSGDANGFMGIMPMKLSENEATIDFTLS